MSILKEYRKLQKIHSLPEYPLFQKPRHELHHKQYNKLIDMCYKNQDELFELLINNNELTEMEFSELMWFGKSHHGTCSLNYGNERWQPFIKRLMNIKDKLPKEIQRQLEWYHRVHGW
jgi:hypothetical protein